MLSNRVLEMSEHLVGAGVFFLVFFALMTVLIARERSARFLGALLRVLASLVVAPMRYLVAGVREMADDAARPEDPERNRQYLLQQLLSVLRAALLILALSTLAVGFAVGWSAMVPSKELRQALKVATETRNSTERDVVDLRAKVSELRRVWGSEVDDRIDASLAGLRRRARESETVAQSAAEAFRSGTSLRLPDDVFGNLLGVDSEDEISAFARQVRRDIAWARTGPVTKFSEVQLEQLETWLRGWQEAEGAFLQFGRELRAQLAAAEERLGAAETDQASLLEANRWKPRLFFWSVGSALVSMLATIWLLGVLLESVWLGVDVATNIRALRRDAQVHTEREA